jgi:uncharacterized spore protein YtfJ
MDVQQVIAQARDAITVQRVFGEPFDKNGVTFVPVAKVQGGAGGGDGAAPRDRQRLGEAASGSTPDQSAPS